jgi:hypothetical protein
MQKMSCFIVFSFEEAIISYIIGHFRFTLQASMVEDAVAGVVGGLAAGCVLGGVYDGMRPLSMILCRISMSGGRRRIFRLGQPSGSRSRRLDATGGAECGPISTASDLLSR